MAEKVSSPERRTCARAGGRADAASRARGCASMLLVMRAADRAVGGLDFYLMAGRYISTDNAYVGAQKVLITPDISGKVSARHGGGRPACRAGDALFEIDPEPFRLASRRPRRGSPACAPNSPI